MRHILLFGPLALAACDVQTDGARHAAGDGKDVHISLAAKPEGGNKVSIDLPGFDANMSLPNIDLGAHMQLDGLKLAPDSKIVGMDVLARDKRGGDDHGNVRLDFTNPGTPATMMDYYRPALIDAGYTLAPQAGDALTATKRDKSFALALAPDGGGSRGTITIAGGEH